MMERWEGRNKIMDEIEGDPERLNHIIEALEQGVFNCGHCKHWEDYGECDPDLGSCYVIERGNFDRQFFCWYWQLDQGGE